MTDKNAGSKAEDKIARYVLDPRALEMLVCPLTKTQLSLNTDKSELISLAARMAFPIKKGVPLLCVSEGRTLDDDEFERLK